MDLVIDSKNLFSQYRSRGKLIVRVGHVTSADESDGTKK